MTARKIIAAICLALLSTQSLAAYCATDQINGNVCKGFIIESCSFIAIHAIEGDSGQMYELSQCYEDVSDYDASRERCWIRTKSEGWGLISNAINLMSGTKFYHRDNSGNFEEVDVEYLTFPCVVI